ncbi:hypothetical protein J9253_19175 [Thiothrix litoralis]|jgi:predicted transcriptional regulator|uniref:HTH marR-type domain-containing protein n=1 Tax=Thiothrix litoralis TaxID=2891210 RepID=A0ABX7WS78_9GAMM|nr:hypothetical protein [Thiothrix litoralis]QTR46077.1 hypothetical protein J9253_19175 [Thiothrix litoralis]
MLNNTLFISIGNIDDDFVDVIEAWESGKSAQPVNKLTFESMAGFLSYLTPKRWELLTVLRQQGHQSIKKLSEILKRDYKNTHTDVKALMECGLIGKDEEGRVCVPWDSIETHLQLAA